MWVYGYGGNDQITIEGAQIGRVSGNFGDDTITVSECVDVGVVALTTADQDNLGAVDGPDTFYLNKCIRVGVAGGAGADTYRASGNNVECGFAGGSDGDTVEIMGSFTHGNVDGGDGQDSIRAISADVSESVFSGGGARDTINLREAGGDAWILGGEGDDLLYGGFGNDRIEGGAGRDWMEGGPGDDTIVANDGVFGHGTGEFIFGGAHVEGDRAYVDPEGEFTITGIEFISYVPANQPV